MLSRSCRPSGHPVSLERSRVELRAFLQTAMRRRVDSRPLTTGAGTDRDPKPEEFWSVPLSPCHGSRMARHQQEVWVECREGGAHPTTAATGTLDPRSEEHTSELQSQSNLVCRLLLEKK